MRRGVFCLPAVSALLVFLACGSRTGLLVPGDGEEEAPKDAATDRVATRDATEEPDADAGLDALEAEADAPIDVSFRDVPVIDECPDAGSTLIYLLTEDNALYSFYPPTLAFTHIGSIACPNTSATPFSMAVDRRGIAYSVFSDGTLFRLDTASAACEATTFVPDQDQFDTFGMGFVANSGDAGETLFVAEGNVTNGKPNSRGLAHIDTTTYALSFVGNFTPVIPGPELTGTSDGNLYAFYTNATGTGSNIVRVDKTTGDILQTFPLQVGEPEDAYAFAYWGGVFWVFTGPAGTTTTVTRYDPISASETTATTLDDLVVGAGVSTCAPQ